MTAGRIYPGERLVDVGGRQALVHYRPGRDPCTPLVVFFPGGGNLARVAYGHPEGRPADFLDFWFARSGHGLLAISYPGRHPIFTGASADFSVTDWANLAAAITQDIVEAEGLSRELIAVGWSMGGRVACAFNKAAIARSLSVEIFIALAATPPIPGLVPNVTGEVSPDGFVNYLSTTRFMEWLDEQAALNGRQIIPPDLFRADYFLETPIELRGEAHRVANGCVTSSSMEAMEDMSTLQFVDYPLVGVITPTAASDATHVLADRARWGFINTQKILTDWLAAPFDAVRLSPENWQRLVQNISDMGDRLCRSVQGSHLFFCGEAGAPATARFILELAAEATELRLSIGALVSSIAD